METSLLLSHQAMRTKRRTESHQHANQAREYAEKAVENARKSKDDCVLAQTEFLLACTTAWKVYVDGGTVERVEVAEADLEQRLDKLRRFSHLEMGFYEDHSRKYLGVLRKS